VQRIEAVLGRKLQVRFLSPVHGDVGHTHADTRRAAVELGFRARRRVEDGIPAQVEWQRELYPARS